VGRVDCWREGEDSVPFPTLPGRSFTRWFTSCPVGQPGSFWGAELHERVGAFCEDFRYAMDYDFWMRLRFGLGVRPHLLDAPVALYRLHDASKTVAESASFAREIAEAMAPHEAALPPLRRLRVRAARRSRRARAEGRRAVGHLRARELPAAARAIASAVATWPPVLLGPALPLGVRALLGGAPESPDCPEMWPAP